MPGSQHNGIAMARQTHQTEAWKSSYQWIMPHAQGYMMSMGGGAERAEEFAHEFFSAVVIRRGLAGRLLAAGNGRVALLRKALHDFHVEQLRHTVSEKRRLSIAETIGSSAEETAAPTADREWAAAIVREAVNRTQDYFQSRDLNRHWSAFEARVLRPILHGTVPLPVKVLAKQAGLKRGDDLSSMLQQVRRRFVDHVLELMHVQSESPNEVQYHIQSLLAMLARRER